MKELTIINEQQVLGKHFAIYGTPEEPLFLAKDVAEWIEHSDVSTMMRTIDETEKLTQTMFVSGQRQRNVVPDGRWIIRSVDAEPEANSEEAQERGQTDAKEHPQTRVVRCR